MTTAGFETARPKIVGREPTAAFNSASLPCGVLFYPQVTEGVAVCYGKTCQSKLVTSATQRARPHQELNLCSRGRNATC